MPWEKKYENYGGILCLDAHKECMYVGGNAPTFLDCEVTGLM